MLVQTVLIGENARKSFAWAEFSTKISTVSVNNL
jgi:hypothetical protein